jgi:hypothetical protein
LIARKRKTPLTISADLSMHQLEVCPVALKGLRLRIDDPLCPASAQPNEDFEPSLISNTDTSVPSRIPKTQLKIHNAVLTAPAAHPKQLYPKVLRNQFRRALPIEIQR